MGLLGWSQGGLVASHVANLNPDLDAVVLWSPVTHPYMTYGKLMGADLVLKASASAAETPFTTTTPWGYETTLKGKFFKEVLTMNPIGAIAHYPGPLLVIQGTQMIWSSIPMRGCTTTKATTNTLNSTLIMSGARFQGRAC